MSHLNHLIKQRAGTLGHRPACAHCTQPADSLLVVRLAIRINPRQLSNCEPFEVMAAACMSRFGSTG